MKIVQAVKLYLRYFFRVALAITCLLQLNGYAVAQDFPGFHVYEPDNDSIVVLSDSLIMVLDSIRSADSLMRASQQKINPLDTIERFHSGFYVKVDYGKMLTLPSKFESKFEGSAGIVLFRRLVFSGVYGQAILDPLNAYKNVDYYTIEGNYIKFGLEYYFSINLKNFLTLGARYAMGNYKDSGKFFIGNEFFEEFEEEFGSENLSAQWFEIVMDTETVLAKNLYLGAQFSLRIMMDFDSREDIPVYSIPGYGRTFDHSTPVVSLYLKYKLPFN